MTTRIRVTHRFTATHAVADDPRFSEPHTEAWSITITVEGPVVEPGWVMPFEDLLDIARRVLPDGTDINRYLDDRNATSEKLRLELAHRIPARLPGGVQLVELIVAENDREAIWTRDSGARLDGHGHYFDGQG